MNEFTAWHNDTLGAKVAAALTKNNFTATYVKTSQEALEQIIAMISPAATVGVGGSWTIKETGLADKLEARGNTMFNHNKPGLSPEESMEIRRKQLSCDVFLTSSNAITLDGKLVNVDGAGNRIAAMIFGPKKVIVIAGLNKIVHDVEEAERRIKLYAAPINSKRLARPNPCVQTGICADCGSLSRICNVTTVMHKKPAVIDIHIFLVGETLGF
jgi:L-lactate utilization protein LutB